jgi:hypothetical protein
VSEPDPIRIRKLRRFGLTMALPLGILGGLAAWRGKATAPYLLVLAAAFLLAGLFSPRVLIPVERGWMKFAGVLSAVMTRVVLFLSFYLVITPCGVLLRLLGKDPLQRRFDPQWKSYWVAVDPDGPCSRPDKPY